MLTKSMLIRCVVLVIMLVRNCDSREVTVRKPKTSEISVVNSEYLANKARSLNTSVEETGVRKPRGFFGAGLFSLGKVLNFFPVGGERECQPEAYTVARAGICLNQYDCRQRDGRASGDCAKGLGVCCVFEVTCGGTVQNNLTYFMSPGFPEVWDAVEEKECSITIDKAFAGIMQLRIDFVHFTIGQPNRRTGECDEDAMIIGEGQNNFTVCGQNHGQHVYYTLPTATEAREADDLPTIKSTKLKIMMRGDMPRLWLLRLAQMPMVTSAPHGCLQYFTANNGTIKTFNYASNGRHLAGQDYKACIRKNNGHCAIRYTPCDNRSFRIGSTGDRTQSLDPYMASGPGGLGGAGTGFYGPDGSFVGPSSPAVSTTPRATTVMDQQIAETQNDTVQQDPSNQEDMLGEEGSGDEAEVSMSQDMTRPARPQQPGQSQRPSQSKRPGQSNKPGQSKKPGRPQKPAKPPPKSFFQVIWSYIWPSWLWGQSREFTTTRTINWRWSPYVQHYKDSAENNDYTYYGYGNFGFGLHGFGRQRCQDRITIPCENEYFVSSLPFGPGVCDPHHCGSSFCPGQSHQHCRVETSITPFAVTFHFGPPTVKRSPEDNIGACLKYQQIPCDA